MKSPKNTLISIGLGVGALVFAFIMVFSDPQQGPQLMQQGGQIVQQITSSASSIGKSEQQVLAPEGRLDMTMNAAPLPSANDLRSGSGDMGSNAASPGGKSSIDSYLDGAWDTPKAAQQGQMQQMPQQNFNRMPQPMQQQRSFSPQGGGRHGFTQYRRGVPVQAMQPHLRVQNLQSHPRQLMPGYRQPGFRGGAQQGFPGGGQQGFPGGAQGMGDFRQMIKEMNQGSGSGSEDMAARTNSQRGTVQDELGVARNQASQARNCLNRARNAQDRSEKQSAASEARSHASQARAAASRARSRASGLPDLQGLADQAHNFANQAENSANDAESAAAGGW